MNRILVNAINAYEQNNDFANITHKDIWYNATDSIYKLYPTLEEFSSKFNLNELSKLIPNTCCICKKTFHITKDHSDGSWQCKVCSGNNSKQKSPNCMDPSTKEYQDWYNAQQANNPGSKPKDSKEYQDWYENHIKKLQMNAPQCQDRDSKEYKDWYDSYSSNTPNLKSKDSEEYIEWHNNQQASSPSNLSRDDPRYIEWYNNLIKSMPNCMNKDSKEYQDWYNAYASSAPNLMDANTKEYQDWYKAYIDNTPNLKPEESDAYKNWYENNQASLPSNLSIDNPRYQNWYKAIISGMPQCMDESTDEYKEWYKDFISRMPGNLDKNDPRYKEWYEAVTYSNTHHWVSSNEESLINRNLPYVKKLDVSDMEYIPYYDDNGELHRFHPDFKIQCNHGIGNDKWEWVEYKGDHLFRGVFPWSNTTQKYNQCKDMVGFVPTSLSWLYEECLVGDFPESDPRLQYVFKCSRRGSVSPWEAWYNPRYLAYAIKNLWDRFEANDEPVIKRFMKSDTIEKKWMVLSRFTIAKIAPCVTEFKPNEMKNILNTYNVTSVYDPFSGLGGRAEGARQLGIPYEGYDINQNCIDYSEALYPETVGMSRIRNLFDQVIETDRTVVTSPPWEDAELWPMPDGNDYVLPIKPVEWWIQKTIEYVHAPKYIFHIGKEVDVNDISIPDGYKLENVNIAKYNGAIYKAKKWLCIISR